MAEAVAAEEGERGVLALDEVVQGVVGRARCVLEGPLDLRERRLYARASCRWITFPISFVTAGSPLTRTCPWS